MVKDPIQKDEGLYLKAVVCIAAQIIFIMM